MELIGQQLRHYEIRQQIASGGYGAIYLAHDTSVNRDVVVKTILPEYANQDEFKQRFDTEARLIAQLEHPHIVPIYSYWQDERGAFLVMRYIRGGNLRDVISNQGALSLIQVQRILQQVCDALDVAHSHQVIHRDIKPENILLDTHGNAYLTDFGIAKRLHTDDDVTATDSILGTWKYLSPEQIENAPVSPQSDIYSLGVMLYEMLAGAHPFRDTSVTLMLVRHMGDPLPNILVDRPGLPSGINELIQKATEKRPANRYPSISALANDFKNIMDGVPRSLSQADTDANITKPLTAPPAPVTSEERSRYAMLQNVRKFWIEGVLESSLSHFEMLNLPVQSQPESVTHPWQKLLNLTREDQQTLNSFQIMDYYENLNGKLLVMGAPGAGKTTLLLNLTRELIFRAEYDPAYPIPVVLNLSSWSADRKPMVNWIEDELHIKYQTPRRIARRWVAEDRLTLMLDGLDEVDESYREGCVSAINAYREDHGFVDIVICSRTVEYQALMNRLMLNGAIRIEPLTEAQIQAYLKTLGESGERIQRLIANDAGLHDLARSPLTLRILVQTYRNVPTSAVPKLDNSVAQRKHLFDLYVGEMIERRIEATSYDAKAIRKYLAQLAKQMKKNNLSIFQIENIQPSWLNDADRYKYHSLFAGFHILTQAGVWGLPRLLHQGEIVGLSNVAKGVIWALSGGVWGIALGTGSWKSRWIPLVCGLVFAMGIALDSSVAIGIVSALTDIPISAVIYGGILSLMAYFMARNGFSHRHIRPVELLRFSRKRIRPLYAVVGALIGIATAFINNSAYNGDPATPTELVIGMILGALSSGLAATFLSGLGSSPAGNASRPNQGMRRTLRNSLQMGLLIGLIFFVNITLATTPVSTLSFGIIQGLISGLAFGFNGFILFGGYAVIQHVMVRWFLARRGMLPLDLARFLDTASSLILLRKVGGGYIFIHRYLLEYFAEMEPDYE